MDKDPVTWSAGGDAQLFEALFDQAGLKLNRVIETESTFHIMEVAVA